MEVLKQLTRKKSQKNPLAAGITFMDLTTGRSKTKGEKRALAKKGRTREVTVGRDFISTRRGAVAGKTEMGIT